MDNHMTEDIPEDAKKKKDWLRDDARLYLQIKNSIESKEQVHRMFEVCMQSFRAKQKVESVTNYFMRLKKITVEHALLLPFSPDVKVQQAQQEKMAIMIFLNGLLPEFGMAKAQILSVARVRKVYSSKRLDPEFLACNHGLLSSVYIDERRFDTSNKVSE
ncbi:Rossmann-like alpha/beta/alpha sandwich [Cucumis melo var. makuwa]|uniref:Rossmann-like alpha/beta/alpha sandwich n=1 Tax=Cucumis melo var. makuwa TaxID=1194695 RepID=A0A5D3CE45_CUCMM|nr:Rossmann-like alpha/beta/alpha sandwich [Cucumis melo var. makuwa]